MDRIVEDEINALQKSSNYDTGNMNTFRNAPHVKSYYNIVDRIAEKLKTSLEETRDAPKIIKDEENLKQSRNSSLNVRNATSTQIDLTRNLRNGQTEMELDD